MRWVDSITNWLLSATKSRRAKLLWLAATLAPFLILAGMVAIFAVNVPFLDQWELVELFKKYHEGQLGFADFFAQHNEHRLLFPRLVMFGLALLSDWNILWEIAASLAFAVAVAIFLYKILVRTIGHPGVRFVALLAISAIIFSPIQWENWLWGWQLQWYLNVLGLVVAVWALTTWRASPLLRMMIAAIAALVATYSLASGLFVWLVCMPIFLLSPQLRRGTWVWLALGASAVALHYLGYHDPTNHPAKTLFLQQPIAFVEYVMAYLGHPVTLHWSQSFLVVPLYLAGIGAAVTHLYRSARNELTTSLLPWLCLGLYACLAALSTAITRLGFGIEQAYASRYTTLSQLLLIMFVVLLCRILEQALTTKQTVAVRRRARIVSAAILVLALLIFLNYAKGAVQLRQHGLYLRDVRHCAQTARSIDDSCLTKLYPLKDVTWQRLLYLQSIHWGGL